MAHAHRAVAALCLAWDVLYVGAVLAPHDVPPPARTKEVLMLSGRILVVEDDPDVATVVEEMLTAEGYEVLHTGAAGALRLAQELRPDVILLDYAMPEMDGAELSRRLRADPTTAAIPNYPDVRPPAGGASRHPCRRGTAQAVRSGGDVCGRGALEGHPVSARAAAAALRAVAAVGLPGPRPRAG
jgi:hypothetical protein